MERLVSYSLLFLISPIWAVIKSFKEECWHYRKSILIMFITVYGANIILKESDGYVLQLMIYDHYVNLPFLQWWDELKQILYFKVVSDVKGDVYSHVLSYLVGNILGIPNHYFFFVSFIYAWFFVNSISRILVWRETTEKNILFWLMVIIFISIRFIDNLQTVRTSTGAWVLFYGTLRYYETRKTKFLFLMFLTPLFHVAYFLMAIPAYLVLIAKRLPTNVFIIVYCLSFITSISQVGTLSHLQITEIGDSKSTGYYNKNSEDSLSMYQVKNDDSNFYKKYGKNWALPNGTHIFALSIIAMGLFSVRKMTSVEYGLFATGIAMATLANFFHFIPAIFKRTTHNAAMFITAVVVLVMVRGEIWNTNKILWRKFILWINGLIFLPYLIYVLANLLNFSSIYLIAFPWVALFVDENYSIRDSIVYILTGKGNI